MTGAVETPDPSDQGSGAIVRAKFRPSRALMASVRTPPPRPPRRARADRLARQLALAHWIERAVEAGQVASYGQVARTLGLTESRITQVTALLGLSPALQERILVGEGGLGIRAAIRAAREVEWGAQEALASYVPARPRRHSAGPRSDVSCSSTQSSSSQDMPFRPGTFLVAPAR